MNTHKVNEQEPRRAYDQHSTELASRITFSIKNPDVSAAMLADKMRAVIETGAEVLCAGDRSCLMHIGGAWTGSGLGSARYTWQRSSPARKPGTTRANRPP
jgi:hypothetical protein